MATTRLAVVSDIHGNRWALEAVLADIARRGIRDIVNLGDSFYRPLDPAGTAQTLLPLGLPTVRGNEDRLILEPPSEAEDPPTLRHTRQSLSPDHLAWLGTLEMTLVVHDDFCLCHGTLERDDQYLLHEITEAGPSLRETDSLMVQLANLDQPVLLCAHDHLPCTLRLPNGRLIVDPGSVGLPAYTDDAPFPHAMQTGSPHARYSVISRRGATWHVDEIALSYDHHSAAKAAETNGRPDWAQWLTTGSAR